MRVRLGVGCLLLVGCAELALEFRAPETRREARVGDKLHGTFVPDPYRWLEDWRAVETQQWVAAQTAASAAFLDRLPDRERLRRRITAVSRALDRDVPRRFGEHWFYLERKGEQLALWVASIRDEVGRVVLDEAKLSTDGTVNLGRVRVSPKGRYVAYWTERRGRTRGVWRVLEVATGADQGVVIEGFARQFCCWMADESRFVYWRRSRQDAVAEGGRKTLTELRCRRIGTDAAADLVLHSNEIGAYYDCTETLDEKLLMVSVRFGTRRENLVGFVWCEQLDWGLRTLIWDWGGEYQFVGSEGTRCYLVSNKDAPRGRLIELDVGARSPKAKILVPQSEDVLRGGLYVRGKFVLTYARNACTALRVCDADGSAMRAVRLPGPGAASVATTHGRRVSVRFESFAHPPQSFVLDTDDGSLKVLRRSVVESVDPARFTVRQVWFQSMDGQRVPMFLAHRADLQVDKETPTYLTGYGGFGKSATPEFRSEYIAAMEAGFQLAFPALRGGGEFGRAWHQAAVGTRKQTTFDDCIAAAEYLIEQGLTSPRRLGLGGTSNGGLLVGAVVTQRPELFGAAIPRAGLFDMIRMVGPKRSGWPSEYGTIEDPEAFRAMLRYSPLHNVKAVAYPPMLITTGDRDDVVPAYHSYKFAAALQHATAGAAPVLLHVDQDSGHRGATALSERIGQSVDRWAFLSYVLRRDGGD